MNQFKANDIYTSHLKEETNKKEATKDAIAVPNLPTRVVNQEDTRKKEDCCKIKHTKKRGYADSPANSNRQYQ